MSMISDLIERLKNAKKGCIDYRDAKVIDEAVEVIRELSEKLHTVQMERSSQYYNGGWIPCSERLPEEPGKYYIVTATEGKRAHVTFAKWIARSKHFDMTGTRTYWRAIAWMPLPEPYEED